MNQIIYAPEIYITNVVQLKNSDEVVLYGLPKYESKDGREWGDDETRSKRLLADKQEKALKKARAAAPAESDALVALPEGAQVVGFNETQWI